PPHGEAFARAICLDRYVDSTKWKVAYRGRGRFDRTETLEIKNGSQAEALGAARRAGASLGSLTDAAGRIFCFLCSRAAPMKAAKSGCGSSGLDLNSGWNWQPRNQGCSGASTIST